MRSAEVRYDGPMTPEEKISWDRLLKFRDELQVAISLFAAAYRQASKMKKPPLSAGCTNIYSSIYLKRKLSITSGSGVTFASLPCGHAQLRQL